MKLSIFALLIYTICTNSTIYAACESVMGACVKDATYDTSSHIKSQIVNKVTHEQPVTASVEQVNR